MAYIAAMPAPGPSALGLLVLLPLVAWRLYARFKRLVGRQRLSRVRPWITLTLFPVLILALAYGARTHAEALAWLAAALGAGALLARYGLAKTSFEATAAGLFYTPNAHLGIALSLLFTARVVYRLVELALHGPAPGHTGEFVRSPLTLAVFGLLAGYYVGYAVGLVRWRRSVSAGIT